MHNLELFVALLTALVLLAVFAERVKFPYPILLVLVGLVLSAIPALPNIRLNPEVVLLIFLPPILYRAAWFTSWFDFKRALRPITLLAVGCVLFVSTGVAWVAHTFIPGVDWATGFLLGAIISPPDAVAAVSIMRGVGLPKRVITILEGESLVNDASALISYKFALAALTTGVFSIQKATSQFLIVAGGGFIVGVVVAIVVYRIHKYINNTPTVDTAMTFFTPFISYLGAEAFHLSGVLAVVTTGIILSWTSSQLFSHRTRIQAVGAWNVLTFILEGVIFLLIGLQLSDITEAVSTDRLFELSQYGLLISVAVVVLRIVYVYPTILVPYWISCKFGIKATPTSWKDVTIISWTGIRGVVSLAAALAIPLVSDNGYPFRFRDEILFITFTVILFTLIVQGGLLPYVARWLKVSADEHEEKALDVAARKRIAATAIEHIEEHYSMGEVAESVLAQIKTKYELRLARLTPELNAKLPENQNRTVFSPDQVVDQFNQVQLSILKMERNILHKLREQNQISDASFRLIEYELDLEESRLAVEHSSHHVFH